MLALCYIIGRELNDVFVGVFMLVYNLTGCQHNNDFFPLTVDQVIDSHGYV